MWHIHLSWPNPWPNPWPHSQRQVRTTAAAPLHWLQWPAPGEQPAQRLALERPPQQVGPLVRPPSGRAAGGPLGPRGPAASAIWWREIEKFRQPRIGRSPGLRKPNDGHWPSGSLLEGPRAGWEAREINRDRLFLVTCVGAILCATQPVSSAQCGARAQLACMAHRSAPSVRRRSAVQCAGRRTGRLRCRSCVRTKFLTQSGP